VVGSGEGGGAGAVDRSGGIGGRFERAISGVDGGRAISVDMVIVFVGAVQKVFITRVERIEYTLSGALTIRKLSEGGEIVMIDE
jgi:hypothetical protein